MEPHGRKLQLTSAARRRAGGRGSGGRDWLTAGGIWPRLLGISVVSDSGQNPAVHFIQIPWWIPWWRTGPPTSQPLLCGGGRGGSLEAHLCSGCILCSPRSLCSPPGSFKHTDTSNRTRGCGCRRRKTWVWGQNCLDGDKPADSMWSALLQGCCRAKRLWLF